MAQGKAFTPEQRETIIQSLKPYLEMGFSRNKACEFVGLTPQTLSNWVQDDEALLMRLTAWENVVNTVAMQNIVDAINKEAEMQEDIRKENSWKWAERRMRQDFATKVENDVTSQGEKLDGLIILPPKNDNSTNKMEGSTETGNSTI